MYMKPYSYGICLAAALHLAVAVPNFFIRQIPFTEAEKVSLHFLIIKYEYY